LKVALKHHKLKPTITVRKNCLPYIMQDLLFIYIIPGMTD